MFNSIKAKIIFITASILLILVTSLVFLAIFDFKKDKNIALILDDYENTIFAEKINKQIVKLETNVNGLALIGESYYKNGKNKSSLKYATQKTFENNKDNLGGGIWFEPYIINPYKKLNCVYAFHQGNKVILDEDFESARYDYINQSWYKEIKSRLSKDVITAWSKPYIDDGGTQKLMTTVGAGIYNNGKLIGISTIDWEIQSIVDTATKIKPTKNSFILMADKNSDYVIASTDKYLDNNTLLGKSLKNIPWYNPENKNLQKISYHNTNYIQFIKSLDNGFILITNIPEHELLYYCWMVAYIFVAIVILLSLITTGILYLFLNRNITKPINKLTQIATRIGNGDFDTEIKLEKPLELANLANTFNKMTKDIKAHLLNINKISKEKERMESELSIAKSIQYSALPHNFYEDNKNFEIYATMKPAKEVGGDFYDFFFISPTRFMFLIADVSGKGIPAALFMMTTKTLIKSLANEGYSSKELIRRINNQICENNEQGFFVTMFAAIVNIETGKMSYINCGHNPPAIKKQNGKYEYLNIDSNLVLGAMNDVEYEISETKFADGDIIFMYTDGVTEAADKNNNLYGEQTLLSCLNDYDGADIKSIIQKVQQSVDAHSIDTEQSDDITMLCFKYLDANNQKPVYLYECPSKTGNFRNYIIWLEDKCKELDIDNSKLMKLELVSEEIFTNIVNYAYPEKEGRIEIRLDQYNDDVILEFTDYGIPFNPLDRKDPDITLSTEERNIGGLGIFMVKQTSKTVTYEYNDYRNILKVII